MVRGLVLAIGVLGSAAGLSAETRKSGIESRGFDPTVRAQDDLFMHVNGEWLKHTPIPDDKSDYGSFTILSDETLLKVRQIIDDATQGDHPADRDAQQVGDFYRSFMNEQLIDERGLEPLSAELAMIDQLQTLTDVVRCFGSLQHLDVSTPIGFYVDQDDKNSTQYLAAIVQSGTTLPDRDYYLEDDPKYAQARQALQSYIAQLFQLCGFADGAAASQAILELETRLARVQWERTELRDAEKRYNKYSLDRLVESLPQIAWRDFLAEAVRRTCRRSMSSLRVSLRVCRRSCTTRLCPSGSSTCGSS